MDFIEKSSLQIKGSKPCPKAERREKKKDELHYLVLLSWCKRLANNQNQNNSPMKGKLLFRSNLTNRIPQDRHRPSSSSIAYSSDRSMQTFITYFSTLLAALLLIGAIIILYNVTIPKWRIALIGIFTTLFAASVGLLTTARRAEVFAATAA